MTGDRPGYRPRGAAGAEDSARRENTASRGRAPHEQAGDEPGSALVFAVGLVVMLAVLVVGPAVVGTAPRALACSCAVASGTFDAPQPEEVMFEGRVVGRSEYEPYGTAWTVQVARVFRGDITAVQPVVAGSPAAGHTCGLDFTLGQSYLINGRVGPLGPGVVETGLCRATDLSAAVTPEQRRALPAVFGPERPPRAAPPAALPAPPRVPPNGTLVAAAISLVAVVVAVGALVAGRLLGQRGRRARDR